MKYWNKLTLVSKITFVIWTIGAIYMIASGESGGPIYLDIATWIIGCLIFVGIAQCASKIIGRNRKQEFNTQAGLPRYVEQNAVQEQPKYQRSKHYDLMEGHEFEYYCADLLRKNGFHDVEVTRGSGDQGIDVIAYKDGMKYGIQCKCYSSDIGNKAVQEAFAGKTFYGCHVAAVLTNRYFTKSAKELSEANKVLLWDRDKLEEFIKEV